MLEKADSFLQTHQMRAWFLLLLMDWIEPPSQRPNVHIIDGLLNERWKHELSIDESVEFQRRWLPLLPPEEYSLAVAHGQAAALSIMVTLRLKEKWAMDGRLPRT